MVENDCEKWGECDWRDVDGVRHYFRSDPGKHFVVIRLVRTSEFTGRSIAALGIGMARQRDAVLANVRRFLPDTDIKCSNYGTDVGCGAHLGPGWFRLLFDKNGQLQEVRFDGYHFI
jgi:hypothetical protein